MIGYTNMAKAVKTVLAAGAMLSLAALSHAAQVTNGDFENTTLTTGGLVNNSNVSGWTTTSGWTFLSTPGQAANATPFKMGTTGTARNLATASDSPNGGHFLASDGAYLNGVESTTITGLTVGGVYQLNFYQALAQQVFSTTNLSGITGHWDVNFGGAANGSTTFNGNIPSGPVFTGGTTQSSNGMSTAHNTFSGWMLETLTFTATAATESLNFYATGGPNGLPPFLLLDGITVTQTVPEPGMLGLAGLSLAGVFFARRRKAAAAA